MDQNSADRPDQDLARRIQTLEDVEQIRRLKAKYCAGCDDDHNPDTLIALFHDDAVWEATSNGRFEGRDSIYGFFADLRASGRIRNSAHHAINPDIEVAGDTATAHWRLIMLYTANVGHGEVEYHRIIGWYKETYRRNADTGIPLPWRFQSLFCQVEENAPYPVGELKLN